jgi:flagellar biosynthesis/type III secretory pathway protein FliH
VKGSARQLGELLYQLGIEHQKVHHELARKTGDALANAYSDGFAQGRETGLADAEKIAARPKPEHTN